MDFHKALRETIAALDLDRIEQAKNLGTLEVLELEIFGRKQGKFTALFKLLGATGDEDRKQHGALLNTEKVSIEQRIAAARAVLERKRFASLADDEWLDMTAPGVRMPRGSVHPVSRAISDITAIFERIGFIRSRHPEVDSDYYAFTALNMSADHPARDEWETFFVAPATAGEGRKKKGEKIVLTPHTSNGQVREMEKGLLPIRMVNIGKCYRRQIDATHTPMFHQFEGFLIDRNISVTHLKGTIDYFVRSYFGADRVTRLRPYHFQFTEPSFEIDISCAVCGGTGSLSPSFRPSPSSTPSFRPSSRVEKSRPSEAGPTKCKTCKAGWLELGGAGMVHPSVLKAGGIDPAIHNGFAFGWGVERVLMMKEGIDDIRVLYGNDLRWLGKC
ncbi:MAG: phenylalanine--tRNA ligase subunit alpha [bacterium]|nr:phenylalanine--tRNA ligase subunit alpha [bacterium]